MKVQIGAVLLMLLIGAYCQAEYNPLKSTDLIGKASTSQSYLPNRESNKPLPFSSMVTFMNDREAICMGILITLKHALSVTYCTAQIRKKRSNVMERHLTLAKLGSFYNSEGIEFSYIESVSKNTDRTLGVAILLKNLEASIYLSRMHISNTNNPDEIIPEDLMAVKLNEEGKYAVTHFKFRGSSSNQIKVYMPGTQANINDIVMGGPLFYGKKFLGIASNLYEHKTFERKTYIYIRILSDFTFISRFIGRLGAFDESIHDPLF